MVSLTNVRASNAQIPTALPKHLVAVFAGATSGIGEATLRAFVKYAVAPRIYLFARNPESAARVIAECRQVNPQGEYEFIHVDLSSIKATDRACEELKSKEKLVNLVVLSAAELSFDRSLSSEGLHFFLAASTYSRVRIVQHLLPLLTTASQTTPLARVVDVASGTKEGEIDVSDLEALKIPFQNVRPHLTSLHTLAWETLAQQAPTVSFVHDFPGSVFTSMHENPPGWPEWAFGMVQVVTFYVLGYRLFVRIEESGERHCFLATSSRYRPKEGQAVGVSSIEGIEDGAGSDGQIGSGVYTVDWDGEGPGKAAEDALKGLRTKGVKEVVWDHFEGLFKKAS